MEETPLISIITPSYNGEKYLDRYFQGVLAQYHQNIELIFVNDGSTDNTETVAMKYGKEMMKRGMKFVYIYQNHSGQAAAINQGLIHFKGDYLIWLDSDDIMFPDNLSKKLFFLEKNSEYGMVMNEIQFVDEEDITKKVGSQKRVKPNGADSLFEDLIFARNVIFCPGALLVRREVVLKAIPSLHIFESKEGQNWQMLLPLAYACKCGYIEEELLKSVIHSDSHSRQKRGIKERMERENNIIILCSETVKNIPGMSDYEKEGWCRKIRIHHNRNKLTMAACGWGGVKRKNYKYYLMTRKELEADGYRLRNNEKYIYLCLKSILGRIKRYVKNLL